MQYLCNQWSDFKNSWSCLILTRFWIQWYTMYPPHLNYLCVPLCVCMLANSLSDAGKCRYHHRRRRHHGVYYRTNLFVLLIVDKWWSLKQQTLLLACQCKPTSLPFTAIVIHNWREATANWCFLHDTSVMLTRTWGSSPRPGPRTETLSLRTTKAKDSITG